MSNVVNRAGLISRGLNFFHLMPFMLFRLSFNVAQLPNKEQEAAAEILADYLDHPRLALPFRLPLLAEIVVDAELTSFGEDSTHDVNIPDRLTHDLIGNYFKPSAVVIALEGKHYLGRLKSGEVEPQIWRPPSSYLNTRVLGNRSLVPSTRVCWGIVALIPFPLGSHLAVKTIGMCCAPCLWSGLKLLPRPLQFMLTPCLAVLR